MITDTACTIILLRNRHLLLRLLKLRIIVNNHDIYECKEKEPVILSCSEPLTKLMVTNGFHSSREVSVKCKPGIRVYEIGCNIDNIQLLTGLFMTFLFFCIYIFSGIRFFMLFANIPIVIMLFLYYLKRKNFIFIYPLNPRKSK